MSEIIKVLKDWKTIGSRRKFVQRLKTILTDWSIDVSHCQLHVVASKKKVLMLNLQQNYIKLFQSRLNVLFSKLSYIRCVCSFCAASLQQCCLTRMLSCYIILTPGQPATSLVTGISCINSWMHQSGSRLNILFSAMFQHHKMCIQVFLLVSDPVLLKRLFKELLHHITEHVLTSPNLGPWLLLVWYRTLGH